MSKILALLLFAIRIKFGLHWLFLGCWWWFFALYFIVRIGIFKDSFAHNVIVTAEIPSVRCITRYRMNIVSTNARRATVRISMRSMIRCLRPITERVTARSTRSEGWNTISVAGC